MARRLTLTPPNNVNLNGVSHGTVIKEPLGAPMAPVGDYVLWYSTVADDIPAWGTNLYSRDAQLRQFWPTETKTASAIFSMCAKYAGFKWALQGPPRTVGLYQEMLQACQFGKGWQKLWTLILQDIISQDNGGFLEIVRAADDPQAPVVSMNHLDAARCVRTGHRDTPVIYYDLLGVAHLLKYYQVETFEEMPSPIEMLRGIQVCALSRMLRAAQIMRDISVYKREKLSGRFTKSLFLVSGVQQKTIDNALQQKRNQADSVGLTRYMTPAILASLDPTATVKAEKLDFASLPDGYDEETTMKWFIADLALAFGGDYQDFAPLPTGSSGSSGQSRMLHQKSIGKGSQAFMGMVMQFMNYRGILPQNVRFRYTETDLSEDAQRTDLQQTRAKTHQVLIMSGILTPAVSRVMLAEVGDIPYDYVMELNEEPMGTDVSVGGDDPVHAQQELLDVFDPSKYEGTPEDQIIPGANTFGAGAVNGGDTSNTGTPKTASGGATGKPAAGTTRSKPASRNTGKP